MKPQFTNPALSAGMWFCTTTVGKKDDFWGKAMASSIRRFEVLKSKDRHAFYTHAGIVAKPGGTTFEARWRYGLYHIDDYIGSPILIGRVVGMTEPAFFRGMSSRYCLDLSLIRLIGRRYPVRVLLAMTIPGMAHFRPTGYPVCSECCAIHGIQSRIGNLPRQIGEWKNQTPDDIADMIHKWDAFEVYWEGVWPGIKRFNEIQIYKGETG